MKQTVYIKEASRIQCIQGHLIITHKDEEFRIFLNNIGLILIESIRCAITLPLLIETVKRNIALIFCDQKHQPSAMLLGLNKHFEISGRLKEQIMWTDNIKNIVWNWIIKQKILMQYQNIRLLKQIEVTQLAKYSEDIINGDIHNREGFAAKVYFNNLFGFEWKRHEDDNINQNLDYGYMILLSMFNRTITELGYNLQLGIHHKNNQNPYNLGFDLMEPFRPIIDYFVYKYTYDCKEYLRKLCLVKVMIDSRMYCLDDAIMYYVNNVLRMLDNEDIRMTKIELVESGLEI